MTFKEQLEEKANKVNEIRTHIRRIKADMEENFASREYRIRIFEIKSRPFAVGQQVGSPPGISLVCPQELSLGKYTKLFIEEINKLGFSNQDITLSGTIGHDFNVQTIILRW